MKQKLLLLILPMLLFATFSNAQIEVWDFGAEQLVDGGGYTYTNMLDVTSLNAALASNSGTVNPGTSGNTLNTPGVDFGGGIKFVTDGTNDRLRTDTPGVTSYDTNVGGNAASVGVHGRIYVNSSGKGLARSWSITTTVPNQKVTLLVRAENIATGGGSVDHYLSDQGSNNFTFTISAKDVTTSSDIWELHATLPTAGEYFYYDTVGKPSMYRIYLGDVELPTIDASNSVGRSSLGLDKASLVSTNIKSIGNRIYVSNVKTSTEVNIYTITGSLVKSFKTSTDTDFTFKSGIWIASLKTIEGQKAVKLLTY